MKLYNQAPPNVARPTPSTPLTSMRTFVARGNVYRVRRVEREPSCFDCLCLGLFSSQGEIGVLDGAETKRRFATDFPYMQTRVNTKDVRELYDIAETATDVSKQLVSTKVNEYFQVSILRGLSIQRTYILMAQLDGNETENWNSIRNSILYHYHAGYDASGQALPIEQVQTTVRRVIQSFSRKVNRNEGPLDQTQGFEKCDDFEEYSWPR